jgi:16S rRNA (guanine527-N7)-methyltransferase
MKGVLPTQEISEIPSDYTVMDVHELKIKGLSAQRHLVIIQRKI